MKEYFFAVVRKKFLQLVDKTEKELVEQEEQVEGKISIGCGEIAAVQLLPKIIESFRRKYPVLLLTFLQPQQIW